MAPAYKRIDRCGQYLAQFITRYLAQFVAIGLCIVFVAGCSNISIPLAGFTDAPAQDADAITTGSIDSKPAQIAAIFAESDVDILSDTLAMAMAETQTGSMIPWSNPDTGKSGTLTPRAQVNGNAAGACREFDTNVDAFEDSGTFRGHACRLADGRWRITRITPADSAL